jgi:putative DNA primase/helicase
MKYSDLNPPLAAALKIAKGDQKPALRPEPSGAAVIPFEARPRDELETAKASSYKMRAIRWLWPNRFAIGKLGLIGDLPDKGKGLISCSLIACVTADEPLPCKEGRTLQGDVIWLTAEDDIEDTIIPRLVAAGANLDRVHIVKMMRERGRQRMFSLITDIDALRRKIEDIGNVALIIIDPMSAYVGVGKVNNSMTSDVRGFLTPLTDLAAEKHVAIIGIMHFNKKADVTNAMLRIADSLAYVAAARHVYVVVDDMEVENRRLFVKAKNNLSPDNDALSYMTGARKVGEDEETGEEIFAPYIIWGAEHVKVTATEAMQAEADGGHSKHARNEASEFLQSRLAGGPVMADDLRDEAEANGISLRTLQRAKKELKIEANKERGNTRGKWLWSLPIQPRSRHDDD